MPREQINYPGAEYEADPQTDIATLIRPAGPAIHVRWSAARGCIQVVVEADQSMYRHLVDDAATQDERPMLYTPALHRGEVNKLIRTLRRARDQAYGRDE